MEDVSDIPIEKLRIVLQENQFIVPSYDLYGGMAGFHDYGIIGVKIKNKPDLWSRLQSALTVISFTIQRPALTLTCPFVIPEVGATSVPK